MPIAVHTDAANEQHYEVAAEYYDYCLGARTALRRSHAHVDADRRSAFLTRATGPAPLPCAGPAHKYSACKFPEGARVEDAAKLLPKAEVDSLDEVMLRADMHDGMHIMDLGCGWGSGALHYAARLPNAKVVGVSNSNGQREHILAVAAQRGLTNLDIVTADASKGTFVGLATQALRKLCGGGDGIFKFDRVVTIEMFEHMKNYETMLKLVSDVRGDHAVPPCGATKAHPRPPPPPHSLPACLRGPPGAAAGRQALCAHLCAQVLPLPLYRQVGGRLDGTHPAVGDVGGRVHFTTCFPPSLLLPSPGPLLFRGRHDALR